MRRLNEQSISIEDFPLTAGSLAELLESVQQGELDTNRAKDVFAVMADENKSAQEAMQSLGIEKVDESALVELCQALLAKNPKIVEDVKRGKQQAVGALIGQAKKTNPNANPGQVRKICLELIEKM